MSALVASPPPPKAIRRFSVDEYHRMIAAGILNEGDPVELLDGYLVLKMPRTPEHDFTILALNKRLMRMVPVGWEVRGQSAATFDDSEPEPDFAIVRGDESLYRHRHPVKEDMSLVIEVAVSSLERDTSDKARIYAAAGVPVYWVVNLPDRRVEVFSEPDPSAGRFRNRVEFPAGDSVPVVLDGTAVGSIPVVDILP